MDEQELRYVLVYDGPSDRVLLPILDLLIARYDLNANRRGVWTEPGKLGIRVANALQRYTPCDILFVHRDAERQAPEMRLSEIHQAIVDLAVTWVPIIPVRMTEAWLLVSENAIRAASGNDDPNNKIVLKMPQLNRIEADPDPKVTLKELLETAYGKTGRRLKQFDENKARARVSEQMNDSDLDALHKLPAFRRFEQNFQNALLKLGYRTE